MYILYLLYLCKYILYLCKLFMYFRPLRLVAFGKMTINIQFFQLNISLHFAN